MEISIHKNLDQIGNNPRPQMELRVAINPTCLSSTLYVRQRNLRVDDIVMSQLRKPGVISRSEMGHRPRYQGSIWARQSPRIKADSS